MFGADMDKLKCSDSILEQGAKAFIAGIGRGDNPHPEGTDACYCWDIGWSMEQTNSQYRRED